MESPAQAPAAETPTQPSDAPGAPASESAPAAAPELPRQGAVWATEPNAPVEMPRPGAAIRPLEALTPAPPDGTIEDWLARNRMPLLVILFSFVAQILTGLFYTPPEIIGSSSSAAAMKRIAGLARWQGGPPPQMWPLLVGLVTLVWLWNTHTDVRDWLNKVFRKMSVRPLPAVRAIDLLATIMAYFASSQALAVAALSRRILMENEANALSMLVNSLALASAVLTAVTLARHRAGGAHGSNGLWPFWKLASPNTPRSVLWDIGIGIASYPAAVLLVSVCLYANQLLVRLFGGRPDEHRMMLQLAQPQPAWIMAVFFFTATISAAFFEELLFRGLMYNVMRRYFGPVWAACAACLIFASLHFIWSQVLGLFALALILTWLYDRTGRLVAGMALHATNNFVTLLISLYLFRSHV